MKITFDVDDNLVNKLDEEKMEATDGVICALDVIGDRLEKLFHNLFGTFEGFENLQFIDIQMDDISVNQIEMDRFLEEGEGQ